MGNADLRKDAKIESRAVLTKTLDQLQRAMKVIPQEVLYHPTFMYIWTLAEARFPKETAKTVSREESVREIARAFLSMCGMTYRGELAKALGLTRKEAGLANRALVEEGFAERISVGVYKLKNFEF